MHSVIFFFFNKNKNLETRNMKQIWLCRKKRKKKAAVLTAIILGREKPHFLAISTGINESCLNSELALVCFELLLVKYQRTGGASFHKFFKKLPERN